MINFRNRKFWCHKSLEDSSNTLTIAQVRESEPTRIKTFKALVPAIAKIAYHNPDFALFFRGQSKDFKINSGKSSCYPSIFRSPGGRLTNDELSSRYKKLDRYSNDLITQLEKNRKGDISKLKKFQELQWSILQHYKICDTPLLDVTHSLRVAASFACHAAKNDTVENAYLFIFALPYPQGTITYSTEDEVMNVRLLNACPSFALRPHFQEGYLVATFPSRVRRKRSTLDFAMRLIAKIEIPRTGFWDKEYHAIPREALYPKDDYMESICLEIKNKKTP